MFAVGAPFGGVRTSDVVQHERLEELTGSAGVYQSPGWLRASADMCPGPVRFATSEYGAAALFVVPVRSAGRYGLAATFDPGGVAEFDLPADAPLALFLGRAGYCSDLSLLPGAPASASVELLAALSNDALRLGAGAGTLPFLPREAAARLVAAGVVDPEEIVLQEAAAVVDLEDLGAFPDGLPASRRSIARRDARRYADSGLSTRRGSLSSALEFGPRLLANVDRHHGGPGDVDFMTRALSKQAEHLDDLSVVLASVASDDEIVAYSLSYVSGSTLFVRLVGLNHERARGAGAYFYVAYAEPIRWALERGLRFVDLGIGSLRPKLLRGAALQPRFGVFRVSSGRPMSRRAVVAASARTLARLEAEAASLAAIDTSLLYSP